MKTIELVAKSIQEKRNETLDSQSYELSKLVLSVYDIRKNRARNPKLKEDLKRDGQLQPITININTGEDVGTVVNGRTRYIEMVDLNETEDIFTTVKVEVYENLTTLEQNYLNAQINISQNPLTPDEKREFIIKHKDELSINDMAKALGLGMEMFKNYLATTRVDDIVLEAWTPKNDGYGRGGIKTEELGKSIRAYERTYGSVVDKKTLNETFIKLGELSENSDLKRDEKRLQFPKIVEKVAELQKNKNLVKKYNIDTIISSASKAVSNSSGCSGDKLPHNSSKKYKIVDDLLKDNKFEFTVLLYAENLYRIDDKNISVESETKRIIDNIDNIIIVGNELDKLSEIEDYGKSLNKKIKIHNDDVIDFCSTIKPDKRNGFIFVNGASLYAQRPEFMNYLKEIYPNSTIAMVFLDLLFGKSQVYQGDRTKEKITVYGGAKNFNEVISKFKNLVKFSKFRKYADAPQEKYIVYI